MGDAKLKEFVEEQKKAKTDDEDLAEKYRRELPLVAEVETGIIRKTENKTVIQAAKDWIRQNVKSPVKTEIGEVEVDERTIQDSMSHGFGSAKVDAIPAVVPVLERGTFLKGINDKDGKPITNYYFAGRAKFGGDEKIVFVRTRKAAGSNNRFYVHEVFTEEQITAAARGVAELDRPFQGAADFYKSLIAEHLKVKEQADINSSNNADNFVSSGKQEDENGYNAGKSARERLVEEPSDLAFGGDRAGEGDEAVELPRSRGADQGSGQRSLSGNDDNAESGGNAGRREIRDSGATGMSDAGGVSRGRSALQHTGRDLELDRPEDRGVGKDGRTENSGVLRDIENDTADRNARNHRIGEDDVIVPGGAVARAKANIAAIKLVKKLEAEGRQATAEEKKVLTQFTGWGSLAQMMFNPEFDSYARSDKAGYNWRRFADKAEQDKYDKWVKDFGKDLHPELGGIFTKDEWDAASRSTLNAFYTDRKVINAMWKMAERLVFRGGKVLEPSAGSGLFFGLMPENLSRASSLTGIELDKMTGKILKYLYPDADIQITGFQNSKRCGDNTQDLVISNVPFGDYKISDKKHNYPPQSIHNYFFSRSIDAVKPGDLCILISTHHSLDAGNVKLCEMWGNKADLVGAVRLPGTAFEKNAGTSVTTDIVIFRKKSNSIFHKGQAFRNIVQVETGDGQAGINEYFIAHPEMALGKHSLASSMFGDKKEYALLPYSNEKLEDMLARAIEALPENVSGVLEETGTGRQAAEILAEADDNMREGALVSINGEMGLVRDGRVEKTDWSNNRRNRAEAESYLQVKGVVKKLLAAMNADKTDERVNQLRKELNSVYDEHFKKFGGINRKGAEFLQDDIEFYTTAAIEDVEDGNDIRIVKSGKNKGRQRPFPVRHISKGQIFKKRTLYPFQEPEKAASIEDAVKISHIYRNGIDLSYVAKLLDMNVEQTKDAILRSEEVFENPVSGLLETRDVYLSGNVRKKLAEAIAAAEDNPAYERNVKILEANQPARISIRNVDVKIGATWIDNLIYEGFLNHLGARLSNRVARDRDYESSGTTRFKVDASGFYSESVVKFSTKGADIARLFQDCLNLKQTEITYKDQYGKTVRDETATMAAREKQKLLEEEFARWLPESEYAIAAENAYNERVNHSNLRKFEVPNIRHYPGANRDIELRPNQKKGVSRALQESCLLAHGVGSGKTMLQITVAMEARRLKTARKPVIIVQGATLSQFASSFKKLYPGANILAPGDKQRAAQNRKRLLNQIATGDWDAVILPHGFFNTLGVNPETEKRFIQEQIDEYKDTLNELGERSITRKQIEKKIARFEERIKKLSESKRDEEAYWDNLGVDMLIVDEAHTYKRGMFVTKMGNVKGIDTNSSQRSFQMLMKSNMIREKTGGKNIILATGTPISNTITEMWTMFRYIRPDLLKEYNVEQFDDFVSMFARSNITLEESQTGEWKQVERLNRFVNGTELLKLWRTGADVVLTEDLDFIKDMPKLKDGKVHSIVCEMTDELQDYIKSLRERRKKWDTSGNKRNNSSVPLEIMNDARKAALDLRLAVNDANDNAKSKTNIAVAQIFERYKRDQNFLGTQLVFADRFQNKETGFNLFKDMRNKLLKLGIPEDEIAIIHEHDKDNARENLFKKVNSGEVRILFGTTEKLGVGVNVQDRLAALHHLDAPLRPMDFEQRNGRIKRPGNLNKEIEILAYGTERTLDAQTFQMLEAKQKFINQLMRGEITDRSFENPLDELQQDFSDMEAAFSGNPLVKEKNALNAELMALNAKRNAFESEQANNRGYLASARRRLAELQERLPEEKAKTEFVEKYFPDGEIANRKDLVKKFGEWISRNNEILQKELGKLSLPEWHKRRASDYLRRTSLDIGHGVKASIELKPHFAGDTEGNYRLVIDHSYELTGPHGIRTIATKFGDASGLLTRISNQLKESGKAQEQCEKGIKSVKDIIASLEKSLQEKFADEQELNEKKQRLKEIEAELANTSEKLSENEKLHAEIEAGAGIDVDNSIIWDNSNASINPGQYLPERKRTRLKLRAAAVRNVCEKLGARAKNAAKVEVVQSFEELPEHLNKRYADKTDSLEGVFDQQTGKVWMIADNISDTARASEVWAHEQIVHHGLRGMLSEGERKILLGQLWLALGGMSNNLVRQVAEAYGLEPARNRNDIPLVMEEVLAKYAEKRQSGMLNEKQERLWRRIVNIVKRFWDRVVSRITGKPGETGYENIDRILEALGRYVRDGIPADNMRLTRDGAMASAGGNNDNAYKEWQQLQRDSNKWSNEVDEFLRTQGRRPLLTVCQTPDVFRKLGAPNLPMTITSRNLQKVMSNKQDHNLPSALLKQLPQALYEPIMVFESATMANSFVVLTELKHEGRSVMAAIHLDTERQNIQVNDIASVYQRSNERWYLNQIKDGKLLYQDKKKSLDWARTNGLQLPQVRKLPARLAGKKLVTDADIVKPKNSMVSAGGKVEVNSYGIPLKWVNKIDKPFTRQEARKAIKLLEKKLPNLLENLITEVNSNQSKKLLSGKTMGKSLDNGFTRNEHFALAANIAKSWKWAAEVGRFEDREERENLVFRKFVAPINVRGEDHFVWITVRVVPEGLKLYSAELLNEKQLRHTAGTLPKKSLGHPVRSFDEIIERLSGVVNNESKENMPSLASLNLSQIIGMGSKQAASLANEPEISRHFNRDDLSFFQNIFQLPHWIAKQHKGFAKIYDRQIRRIDERNASLMKSLEEIPALFGKNRLENKDRESLAKLIWELEGQKTEFEKNSNVEKFLVDGRLENGRAMLVINPDYYEMYSDMLDSKDATPKAKQALIEIRKSLDNDFLLAYHRMAGMNEIHDDAIKMFREQIGHAPNYFPHHRYGKYYIQAKNGDDVVYREHFDALTDRLADEKAKEIAGKYADKYKNAKWSAGINEKLPEDVLGAPLDSSAMEQIIKAATAKLGDGEQAKQIRDMLNETVADVLKTRGWAAHSVKRKGVPGFETQDIERVLYDYKAGLNGWLAKMEAAKDFGTLLGKIDAKKQPNLWRYSSQYTRDMLRNADKIDRLTGKVKSLAFAWYLGLNIKTAVVNATQNIVVGVPRLQMDVSGGAWLWFKGAQDAIMHGITGNGSNALKPDEKQMMDELYGQKVITDAFMTEVRGHMQGFKGSQIWNRFTDMLGMPMSMVERFNRASLALAAYRAAKSGRLKKDAMKKYGIDGNAAYEQAVQFATDIIRDAHFVYGKSNMPEFMRNSVAGRIASPVYTFRTFSHNMLNMWLWALKTQGKEGAYFTAKSLGATMALGGVTALPLYATLMALFQAITGDEDDWTEEIRNALPQDNMLRDAVCYGMPSIAGVNIGGSLKMETPFTDAIRNSKGRKDATSQIFSGIVGIPYDLVFEKPAKITEALKNNNWWRAVEEAVPAFVQNGMKAWRLYTEGQTTMKGAPINSPGKPGAKKLTAEEAIAKAMGFQPVSATKSYDAYAAENWRDEARSEKIGELAVQVLKTRDGGSPSYQKKAIDEMKAWNEKMKKEGKQYMMFNFKDIMRRVNARRKERSMQKGQREKGKRYAEVWGI